MSQHPILLLPRMHRESEISHSLPQHIRAEYKYVCFAIGEELPVVIDECLHGDDLRGASTELTACVRPHYLVILEYSFSKHQFPKLIDQAALLNRKS
jgi:hypothetical protein